MIIRIGVGNVAWACQQANFLKWIKKKLFFLMVSVCCNVGENEFYTKAGCHPLSGSYKKCHILSENDVLYEKVLCVIVCSSLS